MTEGVITIPRAKRRDTRLAVYKLIVDGLGPNVGMCVTSIAQKLVISKQAIDKHAKSRERDGIISRMPGALSPVLYKRGPRSNTLDVIIINQESTIHDGNVSVNHDRLTDDAPSADAIPDPSPPISEPATCRVHINGRVIFQVLRQGDMGAIRIPRPDDRELKVRIFESDPYLDQNGVQMWKGSIPYDGGQVSVQYLESAKRKILYVWPPQCELVPEQFKQAPEIMEARAQEAVNILQKYGGWKLGLLQFQGKIEYASTDERFLAMFPADGKISSGSSLWIDRSMGTPEGETDDPQVAYDIHAYAKATKEIRAGIGQLRELNERSDLLIEITGKLEIAVERVAAIEATLVERGTREVTQKLESDQGVMYH